MPLINLKAMKYLLLVWFLIFIIIYIQRTQSLRKNIVNKGYFWVFTDSHLDIFYQSQSDAVDHCHNITLNNITKIIRKFGQFNCDTPSELLSSAFSASKKINNNVDFILWLGDATSHHDISIDTNIFAHKNLTGELKRFFPDKLIVSLLGNHDNNLKANQSIRFKELFEKANYNLLIKEEHAQQTFMKGGYYYTRYRPPGQQTFLCFIILNSVMFQTDYTQHFNFQEQMDQISWFNQTMFDASERNDRILLLTHIPFGIDEMLLTRFYSLFFEQKLFSIIDKYSQNIIMCLTAHRHEDTFRVYTSSNTIMGILSHSSISPLDFFTDPSIRSYTYDREKLILIDYDQYILNLIETERTQIDKWTLAYRYSSWYHQTDDLTSESLLKLIDLISNNFYYLKRYLIAAHYREQFILTAQKMRQTLCSFRFYHFDEFISCTKYLQANHWLKTSLIMNYSYEINGIINEQLNQMNNFKRNLFIISFLLIIICFLLNKRR